MEAADVKGLLGLLLVDGSLNEYRTPRGGYVQLTLTAGVTESAFLSEKVEEFRRFIPTNAEIVPYQTAIRYPTGSKNEGVRTTVLRFRVSTNKLRPVYNLLYPRGKRRITTEVLEMLGAQAAAWAWAEGARPDVGGSVVLARCGVSKKEANDVADWFFRLTGADSDVSMELRKPRLHFRPEEAEKVKRLLIDYAPESRTHLFRDSEIHEDSAGLHAGERDAQSQRKEPVSMA